MPERKRKFWWLKWLVLFVLIGIIIVVVVVLMKNSVGSDDASNNDEQTVNLIEESEKKDEKQEEKNEQSEDDTEAEKVKQYEGDNPNKSEELTGVVSYAGVSGDSLIIRVNIDQYLSGGNCELSLIRDGMNAYDTTTEIEGSASTSTCKGFNVPISGLGNGSFIIEVLLSSGEKYGKIVGEVNI